MKKILSVLLALALVFTFAVSAFALNSPQGVENAKVVINRTANGSNSSVAETVAVKEDGSLELKPGDSKLKFNGWGVYTTDGKKEAVLNRDYTIVSVTLASGKAAVEGTDYKIVDGKIESLNNAALNITIKPLIAQLFVSELFGNVDVKFNIPSPVTGYDYQTGLVVALALVILGAAATVIASRKRVFDR